MRLLALRIVEEHLATDEELMRKLPPSSLEIIRLDVVQNVGNLWTGWVSQLECQNSLREISCDTVIPEFAKESWISRQVCLYSQN
jgi:hypothetical protein